MKKISIIGLGTMGSGIAANYLKHGYTVVLWNRSKERITELVEKGATLANTPREAAEQADIVFEVTANDDSSQAVWFGDDGILAGATKNTILISSATLSARWTDELIQACNERDFIFFDMPLTGGRVGAEGGSLTLLVGGDKEKLETVKPNLEAISQKIFYFGKAGSGMRYKLLLNMLQAIHICGLGEVLRIAKELGMDSKAVGDALAERPGGTTTHLAWRDYQKSPDPINFSVQWMTKDLKYAKEMAENFDTPLLEDVLERYSKALESGMGDEDWTAVMKTIRGVQEIRDWS